MSASIARSTASSFASTTARRRRRQPEQHAVDAGRRQPLELGGIGRDAHHHDRDAATGALAQLGDPRGVGVAVVRHPRVAVLEHAVEHGRAAAADVDRRVRHLQRLRVAPDAVEGHEVAVERRLVVGPDLLDRQDALAHQPHPRARVRPVVDHLLAVPARADAEVHPPAGEVVEAGDLLRRDDRIALGDEADAAPDPERRRRRQRHRHRDEQVVRVRVLARQRRRALASRSTASPGSPGCACARRTSASGGRGPRRAARARRAGPRRGWGSRRHLRP